MTTARAYSNLIRLLRLDPTVVGGPLLDRLRDAGRHTRELEDKVLGYNVVPRSGRPIRIYMPAVARRDEFADQLTGVLSDFMA